MERQQQQWDPAAYQQGGAFVPRLGEPLLDLLAIKPGERILDLGCGDGALTLKLMERQAQVLGIDASPEMVAAAQAKGIEAIQMDAHHMTFNHEFDAVFSNAALHWMTANPVTVVDRVFAALKPGGRFVAEMGGQGNVAGIQQSLREALMPYDLVLEEINPTFFPSQEEYQTLLKQAGFDVEIITLFKRPTPLPDGIAGWVRVFSRRVLARIPEAEHEAFIQSVETQARPRLWTPDEGWVADYVRLRFVAVKPLNERPA